ncbi:hypothetical protein HLH36_15050 [Gluconacetobacter aggeris]|uniref:Uncharacterized protein n=1 Tax=Gluconacetobacter aggeris TaxID=1286186 RepID=A0A7W4NXI7_9PROT|nr:hypothetical protein [Gluconacetobacter aggeris]MBB2169649.1 hypothetical protein [Gluconacetobacter aggeris]
MPDDLPAVRTQTLARIIGPYLVVLAVALFVRLGTLPMLLPVFMQNGPLVLATGAFTLMAGLAIIALHLRWESPSAIAISLIGIVITLKGAVLMVVPSLGAAMTAAVVETPPLLLIAAAIVLLLGLWLSFVGWTSRA